MSYIEKRERNYLEEIIESWKHIVAFKGGSSIHNKALKHKVFVSLLQNKKHKKIK